MRKYVLILVVILIILLAFPASTLAFWPTPIPLPSWNLFDEEVSIPDAALSAKLHEYTGVTSSEPLHSEDLETLTGLLELSSCGITNAEGIQYCKNVTSINLYKNALSNIPDMSGMTQLEGLDLSFCELYAVPDEICHIPGLRTLSLFGNKLTDVYKLASLTKLKELELGYCGLVELPEELCSMNLSSLSIRENPLGELPVQLSQMTSLCELDVSKTELQEIPSSVYHLINMERLNLY